MSVFFTSDLHLGHARLVELHRRQFHNVADMNFQIIENWNKVVGDGDLVYVLGDVSFMNGSKTVEALHEMAGNKILVTGNHDKGMSAYVRNMFVSVHDILEIKVPVVEGQPTQRIVLCHYPLVTWNASAHGSWMLHGHCHGNLREDLMPVAKRLDVGMDCHNFRPISVNEVARIMASKRTMPVDHHGTDKDYDAADESEAS